ncbi:DUF2207 domain-containing protein [Paenibacillus amylolyticus]|uniref:DUF2207 domain-containing protein n=1 Tax=Paenibacillus amylolyticus TaxID=1451 RepID=A0A5M9WNC6_PAEAM|nr:DUF2207 domain-containing protein [Paenibacillus amylolyticus]KAA8783071.1 DUF2207 domain-containing protein [Paenibacillus amylolyticus]
MRYVLTDGHASSQFYHSVLVQRQLAPILQEAWLKQLMELIIWVLLGIIVVQLLLWVRGRLNKGPFRDEEVEQADPLFLAYLRSKGRLKLKDTQATMFQLIRKGILSMTIVKIKGRYRNDPGESNPQLRPKTTLEYSVQSSAVNGTPDEQGLLDWLFSTYGFGKQRLRLDALAGPSNGESKRREAMKYYQLKEKALSKGVQSWKEQVVETRDWGQLIRTPMLLRLLVYVMFPILMLLTGIVCFAERVSVPGVMGLAVTVVIWFLVIRKIHVRLLYQAACVGLMISLTVAIDGNSTFTSSLYGIIFLSIFVRLFLPAREVAPSARDWEASMRHWRKRYKKGIPVERLRESAEVLEQIIQTALVLGIGSRCVRKTDWSVLQQHHDPELRRLADRKPASDNSVPGSTILKHAPLLVLALHLRGMFKPMSAAEFPFDRTNYVFATIFPESGGSGGHAPVYTDSYSGGSREHSHDHHDSSSGGHHHGSDSGDSGRGGD